MSQMAKVRSFGVLMVFSFAAAACSSGRDVEVKGEVIAPASLSVDGTILVEFVDVIDVEKREVVHSVELDAPGSFDAKVALEGDKVMVRAIADADGNGACSAGESWAEVEATIAEDDTVEPVSLTLADAACPAEG
jgi:hypothetical protein